MKTKNSNKKTDECVITHATLSSVAKNIVFMIGDLMQLDYTCNAIASTVFAVGVFCKLLRHGLTKVCIDSCMNNSMHNPDRTYYAIFLLVELL